LHSAQLEFNQFDAAGVVNVLGAVIRLEITTQREMKGKDCHEGLPRADSEKGLAAFAANGRRNRPSKF
jgi:hypothetical protein